MVTKRKKEGKKQKTKKRGKRDMEGAPCGVSKASWLRFFIYFVST
jgi:hypothetical protein